MNELLFTLLKTLDSKFVDPNIVHNDHFFKKGK